MTNQNSPDISPKEIKSRMQDREALKLLDVRQPVEYHTYNIGGINIPLNTLSEKIGMLPWHHNDEIIVVCSAGLRSQTAQSILKQNGYKHVRNLKGGLLAMDKHQSTL